MRKKYAKHRPDEIPSPDQQLCSQFDPIIQTEMSKIVFDTLIVAIDLLTKSQKPKDERGTGKILSTALALGKNAYPHSHVIDREEARKIGLNVTKDPAMILLLKSYKKWVSFRLAEEVNFHIIEQFSPNKTDDKNEKTEDKIKE